MSRTKAESKWLSRIASLGCALCHIQGRGHQEPEIHHIRTGQGMAERASDFLAIPLCPACHRHDKGAVHGDGGYAAELIGYVELGVTG